MSKNNINYVSLTTIDKLQSHESQWDSLHKRAVQKSAMLSFAWVSNYIAFFLDRNAQWTCVLGYRDSRLVVVMPLVLVTRSWPVKHIIATSPFGSHTNFTDILQEENLEDSVLPDLLDFTFKTYPSIGYIELPRVSSESSTLGSWADRCPSVSVTVKARSYGQFLAPRDDVAEYEKSLSRNFRKNLSKAKNKLARLGDVEYEFLDSDFDVSSCLARFCDLERSGWKGRSGTAIAQSDKLAKFYLSVLTELDKAGVLEWHFLKYEGGDLAGHMAFRFRGKVVLWKLAYDEGHSACSPGSLLMRELVKREASGSGNSEIDLTTDQTWYRNWNLVKRQYYQVRIFNRKNILSSLYSLLGKLRIALMKNPVVRKLRTAQRSLTTKLAGK